MKFDADLFFEMEKLTAQHYYISFADVVNLFLKGQSKPIRNICELLALAIKQGGEIALFDLTDYDPIFDFAEPSKLPLFHLRGAFKAIIQTEGDKQTIEKYRYIGFCRSELERRLNIPLTPPEVLATTHRLKIGDIQTMASFEFEQSILDNPKFTALQKQMAQGQIYLIRQVIEIIRQEVKGDSTRESHSKDKMIKSLLALIFGEEVAESPRKFIEEQSGGQIRNYKNPIISREFEKAGIRLPISGKTLEKWVKNAEITHLN